MNIVLLVVTMIMLMTTMTYARLQNYFSYSLEQAEWRRFMERSERSKYNQSVLIDYLNVPKEEPKTAPPDNPAPELDKPLELKDPAQKQAPKQVNKAPGLSRLSFQWFLKKEKREADPEKFKLFFELSKNLLQSLYGQQTFYKNVIKNRPNIADEILNGLVKAAGDKEELLKRIKKSGDLVYLDLPDVQLNRVFYAMLIESTQKNSNFEDPEFVEDEDDPSYDLDFHSAAGFYSLRDYITLRDGDMIRVYLAPKALLQAIFNDDAVVDAIIKERQSLYCAVRKDMPAEEATSRFQGQFSGKSPFDPILDFTVTKSNPRDYEVQ